MDWPRGELHATSLCRRCHWRARCACCSPTRPPLHPLPPHPVQVRGGGGSQCRPTAGRLFTPCPCQTPRPDLSPPERQGGARGLRARCRPLCQRQGAGGMLAGGGRQERLHHLSGRHPLPCSSRGGDTKQPQPACAGALAPSFRSTFKVRQCRAKSSRRQVLALASQIVPATRSTGGV